MIAYKLITPQITEEEYEEALRTIKESSKEKGYKIGDDVIRHSKVRVVRND